jgi:hypothetical protein
VAWADVYHAYGPAEDVPAQLAAVVVGDDATRAEAWWNLWGNIVHQGTIYEATVQAVPLLFALAERLDHPGRGHALLMLQAIGSPAEVCVWRYGADGGLVSDEAEQARLLELLRATMSAGAERLLDGWRDEPDDVRRLLLWLLSSFRDLQPAYADLVAETLPAEHRDAWELAIHGAETQEEADAVWALEDWVTKPLQR